MRTMVIYDIPNDRIRHRVSEACKDYGLVRIQYSAFEGNLNRNRREELFLRLRRTLGKYDGDIRLVPVCDKDVGLQKQVRNESTDDA